MKEQDTQDIDLSQYKWQGDWEWLQKAEAEDGKRIAAQIGYLSDLVRNMKKGDKINVIYICSNPKYYDVCVKILCVVIMSWRYEKRKEIRDYVFNEKYTEVRRIA